MQLTKEQKEILEAFKKTNLIKINAYAGTGKTTTIIEIANHNLDLKFLVLVFNKSVRQELERKMPSNCTVMTIHALAYKFLDIKFKRNGILTKRDFTTELSNYFSSTDYFKVAYIRDVLERFCNSQYLEASQENIDSIIMLDRDLRGKYRLLYGPNRARNMLDISSKINDALYAAANQKIGLTHDIYLKFFQKSFMAKYIQDYLKGFDALMVDESQDLNGIQEYLLVKVPIKKKVAVGDKHQSIYSWRGAENTLAKLDWQEFYLTVSFRFSNKDIVSIANKFLKNWKGETRDLSSKYAGRTNKTTAHITRTNAQIIELINKAGSKDKIQYTRDIDEIFRSVKEVSNLMDAVVYHRPVDFTSYLKLVCDRLKTEGIKTASDLKNFFADSGDFEYTSAVEIVEKFGRYGIDKLYKKAVKLRDDDSKKIFTTAHSAKGLEFDNVVIEKDFRNIKDIISGYAAHELINEKGRLTEEQADEILLGIKEHSGILSDLIDEINLQYVALTRAIKSLSGTGLLNIEQGFSEPVKPKDLADLINKRKEEMEKSLEDSVKKANNTPKEKATLQTKNKKKSDTEASYDKKIKATLKY